VLCALLSAASTGRAQDNPFEAFARMVVSPPRQYRGPTVAFPESRPRPSSAGWVRCSERVPACVHAAADVAPARVERTLAALEAAYVWVTREGWPLPYPDAALGGSSDFDLYLAPGLERLASAGADAPVTWSSFDAATSYARIDAALPDSALERCALSALIEAGLLGADPAETADARRASAAFVSWLATGELGCNDVAQESQLAPELGPIGDSDVHAAALALWLAAIAQRHDGGNGHFIRELWTIAQQKSERAQALHASPSFFQALAAALDKAGESLEQSAIEFAVARYFAASGGAREAPPSPLPAIAVPVALAPPLAALPKRMPGCARPLAIFGSSYVRAPTPGAREGMRLQVWLRGEPEARWSLVAARLDAQGRELSRMEAPPRRVPESFLPVELTSETASVLFVVTHLPWQHLDERADEDPQCFRLILNAAGTATAP
jgi:hypothetical protein